MGTFTLLDQFMEDVAYTFQGKAFCGNNGLERGKHRKAAGSSWQAVEGGSPFLRIILTIM